MVVLGLIYAKNYQEICNFSEFLFEKSEKWVYNACKEYPMIKKILPIMLFVLTLFAFTSCENLWNVTDSSDVTITADLPFAVNPQSNILFNGVNLNQGQGDAPPLVLNATISIYEAGSDKLLQSVTQVVTDPTAISVTFKKISTQKKVYATIDVIADLPDDSIGMIDPTYFQSRSDDTKLSGRKGTVETRPNAVFLDYLDPGQAPALNVGQAPATGLTLEDPISGLEEAIEVLGGRGNLLEGATIYATEELSTNEDSPSSYDFAGLTVKKTIYDNSVLSIGQNSNITLKNVIIDGNKDVLIYPPATDYALISFSDPSSADKLIIGDGVIVQNNNGPGVALKQANEVYMNGGVIRNNSGAGIDNYGVVYLKGGIISNNLAGGIDWGTVKLSGNPVVTGNTVLNGNTGQKEATNINCSSLILAGPLTGNDKSIGISPNGATIASLQNENDTPFLDKALSVFFSDDGAKFVKNANGSGIEIFGPDPD